MGNDVIYRIPHGEDKGGGQGGDKSSAGRKRCRVSSCVGGGGCLVGNDVIYRIPHGEDKGGGQGGDKSSAGR